jgi:hypothetical protein
MQNLVSHMYISLICGTLLRAHMHVQRQAGR